MILNKATDRRTQAHWLRMDCGVDVLFSYATPIAFSGYYNRTRVQCRRENTWGPTTGRHITETSVRHWEVLGEKEFNERLESSIRQSYLRPLIERVAA